LSNNLNAGLQRLLRIQKSGITVCSVDLALDDDQRSSHDNGGSKHRQKLPTPILNPSHGAPLQPIVGGLIDGSGDGMRSLGWFINVLEPVIVSSHL
jgi:hypothetical protein